jgi:pimeloyl-ACP methyl ester carboxylesterase
MPKDLINGVELFWESSGNSGPAVVLIHGGWINHEHWDEFVPYLEDTFRVLTYDRRGHGLSETSPRQSGVKDDIDDLAVLLTLLDLGPSHLVGSSYGAMVALRLAAEYPDFCLSVTAQDPPLLHLNEATMANQHVAHMDQLIKEVADRLEAGEMESGISAFMNAAVAPNAWDGFTEEFRTFLVTGAQTFIDDVNDPDPWSVNLNKLAEFPGPILLTTGEYSPEFYGVILNEIMKAVPQAEKIVVPEAYHVPHIAYAQEYAEIVKSFIAKNAAA